MSWVEGKRGGGKPGRTFHEMQASLPQQKLLGQIAGVLLQNSFKAVLSIYCIYVIQCFGEREGEPPKKSVIKTAVERIYIKLQTTEVQQGEGMSLGDTLYLKSFQHSRRMGSAEKPLMR